MQVSRVECKGLFRKVVFVLLAVVISMGCQSALAMTMDVSGGDAAALIRYAARNGGISLIMDDSVSGKVSVCLKDATPIEVISHIVKAKNLSMLRDGDVLVIGGHEYLSRSYGQVHVLPVKNGQLEELREALLLELQPYQTESGGNISTDKAEKKKTDRGKVTADKGKQSNETKPVKKSKRSSARPVIGTDIGTRSILLYGTEEDVQKARKLLEKLDAPARQISLEAKIVSMSKTAVDKLGASWSWSRFPQYSEDSKRGQWSDNGNAGGILSFGRGPEGKPFEFYYTAQLDALVSKGQAQLLSKPNIITMQGREAVINVGAEVPVPSVAVTNSTTTTSIEYKTAGIILRCTPFVNDEGMITTSVHTEISTPVFVKEMNAYSFQKRSADTMLQLKDGETMVIGGLISQEESKSFSKVPFLSKIPILGQLFQSRAKNTEKSEIIIFITAKILP